MSTSFSFRGVRGVAAVALGLALFAIPAIAIAGNGSSAHANLAGPGGYCQNANPPASPSIGRVQLSAATATSPGFHSVNVNIRVASGKLAAGTYDVYLVNLYRDATGQITGCSASAVSNRLTVKNNGTADFHGTATRYTGEYELQVYVGPIWGPGYASAPATVDVP